MRIDPTVIPRIHGCAMGGDCLLLYWYIFNVDFGSNHLGHDYTLHMHLKRLKQNSIFGLFS